MGLKKIWYGLKYDGQTPEEAISFYIDEADKPQVRLFKNEKQALKEMASHPDSKLTLFSLTYEEKDT